MFPSQNRRCCPSKSNGTPSMASGCSSGFDCFYDTVSLGPLDFDSLESGFRRFNRSRERHAFRETIELARQLESSCEFVRSHSKPNHGSLRSLEETRTPISDADRTPLTKAPESATTSRQLMRNLARGMLKD
ncbi:hypothetical protein BJX99DRAFT_135774 [Aspergillus californicus]